MHQHKICWKFGSDNLHYKTVFDEKLNGQFRRIISFNMYSRQFVFEFFHSFNDIVDEKNDVFDDVGLLRQYHIACCFKVITSIFRFVVAVCVQFKLNIC